MGATKASGTRAPKRAGLLGGEGVEHKPCPDKEISKALRPATAVRDVSAKLRMAGDPIRLNVLLLLAEGERGVGELCAVLRQSQPAISHHLALLRHSGLIQPRRQGRS